MTDIIERLRQVQGDNKDAREAAAEIMRLRKTAIETMHEMLRRAQEIERLRAEIADRDRIMNMSD